MHRRCYPNIDIYNQYQEVASTRQKMKTIDLLQMGIPYGESGNIKITYGK